MHRLLARAPWFISAVAGLVAIWALLGQSVIAAELADALFDVRTNVALVGDLTHQTADSLEPLANTTVTLQQMNALLQTTTADLTAVNGSMTRMVSSQQAVLAGLGSLNGHTREVVRLLGEVGARSDAMLRSSSGLAAQTESEAATLKWLSASAGVADQHLHTLSLRLAFLERLPF